MTAQKTYSQHARAVLTLGLPLVGSHMAQFAVGMTDTIMLGWYSVEALAAQVLGSMFFFVLFIMGSGFAKAVMPMVATAAAGGADAQVRRVTRMGLWLSVLFGLCSLPLFIFAEPLLRVIGQDPALTGPARDYLVIAGPAILPALVVMVLTSYLSALERTQVVLWVTLAAVGLNIIVNYALIFGNWGMPELGLRGAAWASLSVHLAAMVALGLYAALVTPEHAIFHRLWRADWEAFGQVLRLGVPIGLTLLAEVGLFAASSVMMGWLGTLTLAAHGIALQIASAIFMVHLGLSSAATIRAGRAVGEGNAVSLRRGALVVLAMSLAIALVTIAAFLLVPEALMTVFIDPADPLKPQIMVLGVTLLAAAALFQLADAAQVMALGLLRGIQDTKVPMVMAAVSYWLIGVPASYVLGFTLGWGGVGVWLGLAVGLALAGGMMMTRFWRQSFRLS